MHGNLAAQSQSQSLDIYLVLMGDFPKDGAGLKDVVSVAGTAKACAETQLAAGCDLFTARALLSVQGNYGRGICVSPALPYWYLVCMFASW